MTLYVASIVSFCFPHVVECFEYLYCFACFCCCLSICLLYVSLVSIKNPGIFELMCMGSVVQVVCCILLGLV